LGGAQPAAAPHARPSTDLEAADSRPPYVAAVALVCPLVFQRAVIARFPSIIPMRHHTDDHRRLLDRISRAGAAVIYNSMVFEQTQEDSLTDPLTGLRTPGSCSCT